MPITINATEGDKISIHAPGRVIDQMAAAFDRMEPPAAYDVYRAEDGADLVTTRAGLAAMLAQNAALKAQFDRDIGGEISSGAATARR